MANVSVWPIPVPFSTSGSARGLELRLFAECQLGRGCWIRTCDERRRGQPCGRRNIVGQRRILSTASAVETGRGEGKLAIALGIILLGLALGLASASCSVGL
jgi:hypothetical protein